MHKHDFMLRNVEKRFDKVMWNIYEWIASFNSLHIEFHRDYIKFSEQKKVDQHLLNFSRQILKAKKTRILFLQTLKS